MKIKKKRFIGVVTAMFLLVFSVACVFGACGRKNEEEPKVKGVTLSQTSATMDVEDTLNLTASVSMSSGSYSGSYAWSSSNTESVNFSSTASGSSVQIKAYNAGSSVITVSVDGGFTATCAVTVNDSATGEPATVESISLSPSLLELTLDENGTATGSVTATVKMSDSSNFAGELSISSLSGVAFKQTNNGDGTVTIGVTATSALTATPVTLGAEGKSATLTIVVSEYTEPVPAPADNYAVSVTSENGATEVEVDETLQFTATVTNNGAVVDGATVTWTQSSTDGGTVEFDSTTSGLVTGKTAGTVEITATYTPDSGTAVSGSVTITVRDKTEDPEPAPEPTENYAVSVTTENGETEVEVDGTLQLTATVTNNGTAVDGAAVTWTQSSTDGGAVEFDSTTSGLITGKTAGTVTLTATYTPDGGSAVSGSMTITVKEKDESEPQPSVPEVSGITLSGESVDGNNTVTMTLANGTATAIITAKVVMSDGSNYSGEAPRVSYNESCLTVTVGSQDTDGTYTLTITASGVVTEAEVTVSLGTVSTTFTVIVNAEPHTHTFENAHPSVDWTTFDASEDKTTVQVTYTCSDENCDQSEGCTVTITANVTSVDTSATCTENAYTTYTATWEGNGFTGSDTHVVTHEGTAGHAYSAESEITWTWTIDAQDGKYTATAVVKCDNCDETVNTTVSVTYDSTNIRYTATATIEGWDYLTFTDVLQERVTLTEKEVMFSGVEYKANPDLSVTVTENSDGGKVYEISGAAYGLTEEQLVNFPGAALGDAYVAVSFYVGYGETLNYGWDGNTFTKTTGQNTYEDDPWGTLIILVTQGGTAKFELVKTDGTSEIFWVSFESLTYNDVTIEASSTTVSVETGKSESISVTVTKNGVDITNGVALEWEVASETENLISLEYGVITARYNEGVATVTVTYRYGEGEKDCVFVIITINVVSSDQKEAEERLTAVKEDIEFNGATFTNQTDVSFVFDHKSDKPDETYGYYYTYMRAEGTASSMNATQLTAFGTDDPLHTPYVVLTITLNPGETVSYKSGRSVTNETDKVDYDVVVVSISNYGYYQFKITSQDDSVGTMYVVDFSQMTRAAGHAYPEASEGLTWNWEGRDTENKTVDVSFVCDDHVVYVTASYTLDETTGVMAATAVFDEDHSYEGCWNLSTVGTAAGLVNAFAESETEVDITLTANVKDVEGGTAVYDAFYYTFYYSTDTRAVTVDLGGHTLDLSSDIYTFVINGNDVTFKNGTLILPDLATWEAYGYEYDTYGTWGILEVRSGSLTFDGITIEEICGTAVFVDGDGAKATIKNSSIKTTGAYGVGTNASDPYDCEITIENSYIIANAQTCDGTGIFMNVPGKLTVTGSYIEGDVQALVARGGNVAITDSTLALSGKYTAGTMSGDNAYSDDYCTETVWGGGNNLPYAALVLGNNHATSYQYPTTAVLTDVTVCICGVEGNAWYVYAYSCNSACAVTLSIEGDCNFAIGGFGITYTDGDAKAAPTFCNYSGDGVVIVSGAEGTVAAVNTAETLIEALSGKGEITVTVTADIADGDGSLLLAINKALEEAGAGEDVVDMTIDLGSSALTFGAAGNSLTVGAGNSLTIIGAEPAAGEDNSAKLVAENITGENLKAYGSTANISVAAGASLTLRNIDVVTNSTGVFVQRSGKLLVEGSSILSYGMYGIGTNNLYSGDAVITLKDSSVTVEKPEDDTSTTWTPRTAVFVNVPCELTIDGCVITSTFQGVVVRGGTARITNTEIIITADFTDDTQSSTGYENYYFGDYGADNENAWGTANALPHAGIVIGNNGDSAYNTATSVALDNVSFSISSKNAWAIYAYSCGGDIPVTMTIENCAFDIEYLGNHDLDSEGLLHAYCGVSDGGGITVGETLLKEKPYVTGISLDVNEYTLDLNGDLEFVLSATVTMSDGGAYEGEYAWAYEVTSGEGVITPSGFGAALTITAASVGIATVTVTVDGYTASCVVTVVDTTPKESDAVASVYVDFSNSESYSWIDLDNNKESNDGTGLLTSHSRNSGNAWEINGSKALRTQAATDGIGGYFAINLTDYTGYYVSVTVNMSNTGNNDARNLMLGTNSAAKSVSDSGVIRYVASTSANEVGLTYVMYISDVSTLYLTWDNSIHIYTIDVKILEEATPSPIIESASLTTENDTLILVSGETVTTKITLKVTADGTEVSYEGGYTVSVSDEEVLTIADNGNGTFIVTAVGIGTATVDVALWNAPSVEAACTIKVEANYVGSITVDPTTLTIEKGETGQFTFSVGVTTKAGETYTGPYDISVESKDTDVAVDDWDTSGSCTVNVSAVGQGMTSIVITVTVDGVVLASDECVIEVTDSNQTSLYVDFSNSSTYYWIETNANGSIINANNTVWIVTLVATTSMTIGSGYMVTASASNGTVRYIEIDLSQYEGKAVSVTATMRSNTSGNRSLMLSTTSSNTLTTSSNTLAYATSSSTSDEKSLAYTGGITEGLKLYLTWDNSIRIYDFKIEILDDLDPEVQGVTLSRSSLTLQIGKTETAEITAAVEMNFGSYDGQYSWSVEGDVVTISGDGATITVIAVTTIEESSTATVAVSIGDFTASCVVTVLVAGDEPAGTEYTVHFTIGENDFTTNSEMPSDEEDQVKLSYSNTYSTSGKTGTYTDGDGTEYSYTKGIKVKTLGSNDVIITIPEGATNVTITIVGNTTVDRSMNLVDDDGNTVTSHTFSSQVESFTCTGLEGGVYHITASNDSYVLAVIITYTI